jgi:hypothetical protein
MRGDSVPVAARQIKLSVLMIGLAQNLLEARR